MISSFKTYQLVSIQPTVVATFKKTGPNMTIVILDGGNTAPKSVQLEKNLIIFSKKHFK